VFNGGRLVTRVISIHRKAMRNLLVVADGALLLALSFALLNAGKSMAARIAIMAIRPTITERTKSPDFRGSAANKSSVGYHAAKWSSAPANQKRSVELGSLGAGGALTLSTLVYHSLISA